MTSSPAQQTETQDQSAATIERLKVLITSDQPMKKLETKLANLEVDLSWQKIPQTLGGLEDTFTFLQLKPVFEEAEQSGADLVIALDTEYNRFTLGVRKFVDGKFILLNIHHISLLLARLLLENQGALNAKRSIFVTDLLDKLFAARQGQIEMLANLPSPLEEQEAFQQAGNGDTLFVSENQEIILKGQKDSLGYLLSQLVLAAKKAKSENRSLFETLLGIYHDYGFQREKNLSVSTEDATQKAFFKKIFNRLKKKPPLLIGMTEIISIEDLGSGTLKNMLSGRTVASQSPGAEALLVQLANNTRFLMFPTEQKVNFFFISQGKLIRRDDFTTLNQQFDQRVVKLLSEINRLALEK